MGDELYGSWFFLSFSFSFFYFFFFVPCENRLFGLSMGTACSLLE